jgi:hypothetical protein
MEEGSPLDQVAIDGRWPSPSSGHSRRVRNPSSDLGGGAPHLAATFGHGKATSGRGASRQARRGAAGLIWFPGRSSCMTAEEELARGSRRSSFRRPWVKKRVWLGCFY